MPMAALFVGASLSIMISWSVSLIQNVFRPTIRTLAASSTRGIPLRRFTELFAFMIHIHVLE